MKSLIKNQNGSVLMLALIIVIAILVISIASREISNLSVNKSGASLKDKNVEELVRAVAQRIMLDVKSTAQANRNAVLSQGELDSIHDSHLYTIKDHLGRDCQVNNFFITKGGGSAELPTNKSSLIPRNGYFPEEWANLDAEKKRYNFLVKVACGDEIKMAQAHVSLYNVPLFQFLNLSNFPMEYYPGSTYNATGRLHSNDGFRVGGYGPVIFAPDDLSNNRLLALSTAGKLWSIWKLQYNHPGEGIATYYHSAKVLLDDEGNEATFAANVLGSNTMNIATCQDESLGNDPANHCVRGYNPVNNFITYNREIDANNADFKGRVATETAKILPNWYEALEELSKIHDPNNPLPADNFAHEVIEVRKSYDDDPGNEALKLHKKWYQAQIRIVDGISVDELGQALDDCSKYDFCTDNVKYDPINNPDGFVKRVSNDLYIPLTGRNADVSYLDVGKLNQKIVNDSHYAGVNHIFIGGSQAPRGQVQFPNPGCSTTHTNSGWDPLCRNEDGTDCSSCDPTNVGSQDAVIIHNAETIPSHGLQISSPNMTYLAGDVNTATADPLPLQINSDTITHLSNEFLAKNASSGWNYPNPTGKTTVDHDVAQNFVTMSGFETPLIENWGDTLTRNMSFVQYWRPKDFPPPAGVDADGNTLRVKEWHKLAWAYYYSPATWVNSQWNKDWSFVDNSEIAVFLTGIQIDFDIDVKEYDSIIAAATR